MIYFCADDYGISAHGNNQIEYCLENGVLNKVSVLPNGNITNFKERLSKHNAHLSLHINLIEGLPLSNPEDISLLISEDGYFKHSFAGLFFLSLSPKKKEFEKQIYTEIQSQLNLWKDAMGENAKLSIDSHQHTHMIPLIFKTLMRVIRDEGLNIKNIRIPDEPLLPYILTPSLFPAYISSGLVKQWILKFLSLVNRNELRKSKIPSSYFMGIMFSGKLNEVKIKKVLPHYLKLSDKRGKDIEICFHPGYSENKEDLIPGSRKTFGKFYFSPWRKTEYDTLLNLKF